MKSKPRILITTGDPKGIGPEVTKKALDDSSIKGIADFLVIRPRDKTGLDAIEKAVGILKSHKADGLVTAPVNKSKINTSGMPFRGHTEYLARSTHTKKFTMMLAGPCLRTTIVTRHIALKEVSMTLTEEKVRDAIILTDMALRRYFKIKKPRIGVCSLNPHCGEGGLTGTEERDIIIPAIEGLVSMIRGLQGPLPSDVIFYMARNGRFDAVVSMYHDQGLGPFKMLHFEKGVNVTLGLPFVRTSPDHGTAYDIAHKGVANPASMKEAIRLAARMCKGDLCVRGKRDKGRS